VGVLQVLNLADCIKVAIDFVSPENIARCAILTEEFREQNTSQIWKEDVLQLKTMMWYAWLSCRRQEKKATEKEAATMDDAVVAAAAAT
jgi:[histone H3]-dimethyl-L-lysine9 demethylase